MPALAAELVRARPDVVFARGAGALSATRKATATIPIVADEDAYHTPRPQALVREHQMVAESEGSLSLGAASRARVLPLIGLSLAVRIIRGRQDVDQMQR